MKTKINFWGIIALVIIGLLVVSCEEKAVANLTVKNESSRDIEVLIPGFNNDYERINSGASKTYTEFFDGKEGETYSMEFYYKDYITSSTKKSNLFTVTRGETYTYIITDDDFQ
jgi:hypothetical protein